MWKGRLKTCRQFIHVFRWPKAGMFYSAEHDVQVSNM